MVRNVEVGQSGRGKSGSRVLELHPGSTPHPPPTLLPHLGAAQLPKWLFLGQWVSVQLGILGGEAAFRPSRDVTQA